MSGGDERDSERGRVRRVAVTAAAVLLVAATFGPSIGVALGASSSSGESLVSPALVPIPDPTTGPANDTASEVTETAVDLPCPTLDETSRRGTSVTTGSDHAPSPTTLVPPTPDTTTRADTTRSARTSTRVTTAEPTQSTRVEPPQTTGTSVPTSAPTPGTTERSGSTTERRSPTTGERARSPTTDDGGGRGPSEGSPNPGGPPGTGSDGSFGGDGDADWTGPPANHTGRPAHSTQRPTDRTGGPTDGRNATVPHDAPDPEVNVSVGNASANESVSVDVTGTGSADDGVSFSSVNVTPTRDGSFSLNVTASEDPIAGKTPSVDLSNGTRPLAYLSVDHSIDDANISQVTFTFRVRTDRVTAAERDDVALYRFHDGAWNELPTALVRETDDHYVYRVRSPGLSEFAAAKQRPEFHVTNASLSATSLSVGDTLTVRVRVVNRGSADGTFTADLALDGEPVARHRVTIAADGGVRQTTFERRLAAPGTYEVAVGDYLVGEVTVTATATTRAGSPTASDSVPVDRGLGRDASDGDVAESDAVGLAQYADAGTILPFGTAGTVSVLGVGAVVAASLAWFLAGRQ